MSWKPSRNMLIVLFASALASCGGGGASDTTPPVLKLVSIALSPLAVSLAPRGTVQLTVTGTYSDGSTAILAATDEIFQSSDTGVVTINASGLATVAENPGTGATATISVRDTASGLSTAPANSTVVTVKTAGTTLGNAVTWSGWSGLPAGEKQYREAYMGRLDGPTFLEVRWCLIEPDPPVNGQHSYNWSYPDAVLDAAQGRPVDLRIDTGNCWGTSPAPRPPPGHTATPRAPSMMVLTNRQADYEAFVTALVQRYSARGVHEYGVQNEPTNVRRWDGTGNQNDLILDLVTLTGWTVQAIRQADPNAEITDWGMVSYSYGAAVAKRLLDQGQNANAVAAFNTYNEWGGQQRCVTWGMVCPATDVSDLQHNLSTPLATKWLAFFQADQRLFTAAPGQAGPDADVRDVKLYKPPSNVPPLMNYLHATTPPGTPIDFFEVGQAWPANDPPQPQPTGQQQIDWMVESVTQMAADGARTVMWLPLVNHDMRSTQHFGLISATGTGTPPAGPWPDAPGQTYLSLASIVQGAALPVATTQLDGGAFATRSGGTTLVIWATGSNQKVTLSGITTATTDTGHVLPVSGDTFTVGATPVFVTTTLSPSEVLAALP